ncbi:hypothetical protein [Polaromonas sp.]|uniref:hypothetical protein n=1 Tax=Polaromonas sp. TaxID=1869339 RepID=UPI003C98EAD6
MQTPKNTLLPRSKSSSITPLGIIATFVALSETVAGLAAIKTTGSVQFIFACFAVIFPILIACAFFFILWKRAYVFYPPQDFGSEVDVKHYVDAMRHQAVGNQELHSLVKTTITETLRSHEAQIAISNVAVGGEARAAEALNAASEVLSAQAVDRLHRAVLTVNVSAFEGSEVIPELVFPYDGEQEAFTLLSAVYYQISDHVRPFTYGKSWALQDRDSGNQILPPDVNWRDNYALADSGATVEQMGIRAGMTLLAVPLKSTGSSSRKGRSRGGGASAL